MADQHQTRREALSLLGAGAASLALAGTAAAQPVFAKGAVIRTVLKDYAPEELAGGASLFHEHMSQPPDFMGRWNAAAQAARASNVVGRPPVPSR